MKAQKDWAGIAINVVNALATLAMWVGIVVGAITHGWVGALVGAFVAPLAVYVAVGVLLLVVTAMLDPLPQDQG